MSKFFKIFFQASPLTAPVTMVSAAPPWLDPATHACTCVAKRNAHKRKIRPCVNFTNVF